MVLGVDPGTAITGFGVVATAPGRMGRLVECGVLRTRPADDLPARLLTIHQGLTELLARHRPDVVAVEGVFYGSNARTTVVLGHARGVILLAAAEAGIPVEEYSPAMIKKAVVGRGAALKPQVGFMVARLLHLRAPPRPADAADGVAVALTHVLLARRPRPLIRPAR
ncbi:MAG TPA: crossover junction endodeoxyribonuclease RuvC [Gemmatimonadales bacterium]